LIAFHKNNTTEMMTFIPRVILLSTAAALSSAAGAPPKAHQLNSSYSFNQYLQNFDKTYPDPREYRIRSNIFASNLAKILSHNEGRLSENGEILDSGWVAGVNYYTDQDSEELPFGYNKMLHEGWSSQLTRGGASKVQRMLGSSDSVTATYSQPPDFTIDEVEDLPDSIDWTEEGHVNPVIPQQSSCGSCWSFAVVGTVESHLSITTGEPPMSLSEQNILACAPDPDECGGKGGCSGSTVELGLNYVADATAKKSGGLYDVSEVPYNITNAPYDVSDSTSRTCTDVTEGHTPSVGVSAYTKLPTNDYKSVMNAVAKKGPVGIAVAAGDWSMYEKGVFDTADNVVVNHAVLLVGYGVDEDSGEKFYKIRNSWGSTFGEHGYIRVKRTDDDSDVCDMDNDPSVGVACARDNSGNNIDIKPVKVCGISGVLFDASYPRGVHKIEAGDSQ